MALPGQIDMAAASPLAQSGYELVATESGEAGPSQWQVVGDESQLLAVLLNPGQSVMSEPVRHLRRDSAHDVNACLHLTRMHAQGAMLSTSDYIQPELDMGGVGLACQRACCAQESCFRVHYKNVTGAAQHVTFSPAFPAKVVALNMDKHPHGFFLSKRSWMAGIGSDQEFGVECNPSFLTMCCACQGLMLTTFKGSGDAFLNAGGTVLQRTLGAGEKIIVGSGPIPLSKLCTVHACTLASAGAILKLRGICRHVFAACMGKDCGDRCQASWELWDANLRESRSCSSTLPQKQEWIPIPILILLRRYVQHRTHRTWTRDGPHHESGPGARGIHAGRMRASAHASKHAARFGK